MRASALCGAALLTEAETRARPRSIAELGRRRGDAASLSTLTAARHDDGSGSPSGEPIKLVRRRREPPHASRIAEASAPCRRAARLTACGPRCCAGRRSDVLDATATARSAATSSPQVRRRAAAIARTRDAYRWAARRGELSACDCGEVPMVKCPCVCCTYIHVRVQALKRTTLIPRPTCSSEPSSTASRTPSRRRPPLPP